MKPVVNSESCDYRADGETVYNALKRVLDPLEKSWERLEKAKTIAIKSNQAYAPDRAAKWKGYYQDLVDNRVFAALVRILQERTTAKIILTDICVELQNNEGVEYAAPDTYTHRKIAREMGVEIEYGETPPYSWISPSLGGLCLDRYMVPARAAGADEIISLQKMKSHGFAGVTLSVKNLFGLMAHSPWFMPRPYFHHFVRLPYMLADLADAFDPALSVIDGLWSATGREWRGEALETNLLMAGDNSFALDAIGTTLMGGNPLADLGESFFLQERNLLKIAHDKGLGTADPGQINYMGKIKGPVGSFYVNHFRKEKEAYEILRSTCEQGLYYAEHEDELIEKYGGNFVFFRNRECVWCNPEPTWGKSRSEFPGKGALWFKYIPKKGEETVKENFQMYEDTLKILERLE
jgi:uncharacterized protein (DUF362 family)